MSIVSDVVDSVFGTSNSSASSTSKSVYKYQGTAASQLNNILSGKTDLTDTSYFKTGLESVQRTMAQQGYTGSGNAAQAIANYGSEYYTNYLSLLNTLAGGSDTTRTAASQQSSGSSTMSELGTIASIFSMFL